MEKHGQCMGLLVDEQTPMIWYEPIIINLGTMNKSFMER